MAVRLTLHLSSRKAYSAGAYLSDNNNGKGFIGLIASGILTFTLLLLTDAILC